MSGIVICGGGPVGSTLASSIAAWGVPVTLVERHRGISPFPKGRALSTRTMEVFRRLGIEDELTDRAMDRSEVLGFFYGPNLVAPDHLRIGTAPPPGGSPSSPTFTLPCSQEILEEILRARVMADPAIDARFGWTVAEATHSEAVDGGARVKLLSDDGASEVIDCDYLVAADGAASGLRAAAGIDRVSWGEASRHVNVLFEGDLGPLVADRASLVYTVSDGTLHATLLPIDGRYRWLCNVTVPAGVDADAAARDRSWCTEMVAAVVGAPVPFEVIDALAWTAAAASAVTYQQGPLLLVGDAAHVATPYGGFGMNAGIADADNLGWKLASTALDPSLRWLVDTYDPERRPVGEVTVAESARRLASALESHRSGRTRRGEVEPNPSDGLVLGAIYRSAAIARGPGDALDVTTVPSIGTYEPSAQPGARAPHVALADGHSILDRVGTHHSLLRAADPGASGGPTSSDHQHPWFEQLDLGVHRLEVIDLDDRVDPSGAARCLYGLADGGEVLIRPDGHIAARSDP